MSWRHSGAMLETTRSFYCIQKVSMSGSICHFCRSEVSHVEHRSTALNFDCSLDAKTNLWIPQYLGSWMFFKALFLSSLTLTALFLLTDSKLKIQGENT